MVHINPQLREITVKGESFSRAGESMEIIGLTLSLLFIARSSLSPNSSPQLNASTLWPIMLPPGKKIQVKANSTPS